VITLARVESGVEEGAVAPFDEGAQEVRQLRQLLAEHGYWHWIAVLLDWLGRFDGWAAEYLTHPGAGTDFRPYAEAVDILQHWPKERDGDDLALAARLSRLGIYRWRAAGFGNRIDHWHPMVEPFRGFLARGPTHTNVLDRPFQPATVIEHWLLGRVYSARIAAGRGPALGGPA
jgi:hypothetical protein